VKLVFSSVFEQDFAELVVRFTNEASSEVAHHFIESTIKLVRMLRQHPELGRPRKDLRPAGIRSFRLQGFERYLLFYQVEEDNLVLLRLRYGGMDLPALFPIGP
jgi:addiction module RelE/StbE family toxin